MRPAELLCEYDEERWLEALDWHALRCSAEGLTPEQGEAWGHWSLDSENRRVYAACAHLHRDALTFQNLDPDARIRVRRRPMRIRLTAEAVRASLAGVLLAACVAGAVLLFPRSRPSRPQIASERTRGAATVYRSAAGQTRRLRLGDGSRVVLGAETVLEAKITRHLRAFTLQHGEAWFDVDHRKHWPFVVTAGAGEIRDLGTAFVVDREAGRTEVTVTEGHVEVSLAGIARAPHLGGMTLSPIQLHRGERFVYGRRIPAAIGRISPRLALGWTRGRLEFVNEPLGDVAENLSRYSPQPIRVSPAAAGLHLTTLVLSHHIRAWISGLSRVLPVTAVRTTRGVCIRLRAPISTRAPNECHEP